MTTPTEFMTDVLSDDLPTLSTGPGRAWTPIDSSDAARSFVGHRVEVDAPKPGYANEHALHRKVATVAGVDGGYLRFEDPRSGLSWSLRRDSGCTVRLRDAQAALP